MSKPKVYWDHVEFNDACVKTYFITDYPKESGIGILADFTDHDYCQADKDGNRLSVNTAIHFRHIDLNFNWMTNNKINRLDAAIESADRGNASDKPRDEDIGAIETLLMFRDKAESSDFVEIYTFVTIASDNKKFFKARKKKFEKFAKDKGFKLDRLNGVQQRAFNCANFCGDMNLIDEINLQGRIVDDQALKLFYPYTDGSISDGRGAYIGHRVQDMTAVYKDYTDDPGGQNKLVIGPTGCGKSALTKGEVKSLLDEGFKVYIYDVDGEYRDVCDEYNGAWIDLTQGSGRFVDNTYIPKALVKELKEEGVWDKLSPSEQMKAVESDEDRYLDTLNRFKASIALHCDKLDKEMSNAIEKTLIDMWVDAGIEESQPESWTKREKLGLKRWFNLLTENTKNEAFEFQEGAINLRKELWSYFEGGQKRLYQIPMKPEEIGEKQLVVLHVASAVDNEADQAMGAIKFMMANNVVWPQVKRDRLKKQEYSVIIYDEFQRAIKNPVSRTAAYRDVTTARKFNAQTIIGFNDPSIIFAEQTDSRGDKSDNSGLWENARYIVLFAVSEKNIDKMMELSHIPDEVIHEWRNLGEYEYILMEKVGGSEYIYDKLKLEVPDEELELSATRGTAA